jgi:hypothetical protein
MGMQTDVLAGYLTANGVVYANRTRVRAIHICINTAGTNPVILYDNASSASGTVLAKFGANAAGNLQLEFPGEGILAQNGVYGVIGSAYSMTVFYG